MSDYNWGLDAEVQKKIIEGRIAKLAQDGYQHELNYKFSVEQSQEEAANKFKSAMDGVKASLDFHLNELKNLS